jgi:hypothetical protein
MIPGPGQLIAGLLNVYNSHQTRMELRFLDGVVIGLLDRVDYLESIAKPPQENEQAAIVYHGTACAFASPDR